MASLRRRARSAGIDSNHWYPACWSRELRVGSVLPRQLWGTRFVVFRGEDGIARALHDRCAHRPVPLALGHVAGCNVVCPYHGWTYDGDGRLVDIPHSLFGKKMPKLRVPSLATRERYGLVWIFGGDPESAGEVPLPEIAPLDGDDPWPSIGLEDRWKCHHSAVIDNVMDLSHAYLHRRFRPFENPELIGLESDDEKVHASYRIDVGGSAFLKPFLDPTIDLTRMTMTYIYPHHCSNTDDHVRHWTLLRPIDVRTTHVYVIFVTKSARIPGTKRTFSKAAVSLGLRALRRLYIEPLLEEDRVVLEAEQRLHDEDPDAPAPELNPVVRACHALTARKADQASLSGRTAARSAGSVSAEESSSGMEGAADRIVVSG